MSHKKTPRRKRPRAIRTGLSLVEQRACLRVWRRWIIRIKAEVGDLLGRREIFVGVRAMLERNPEIGKPDGFLRWTLSNYVEAITVGIRRLCDTRDDVVSLSRLLRQILEAPEALTLRSYELLYPAHVREHARGAFEGLAGRRGLTLSSRKVRGDLRRLENVAAKIQRYVNKRVAHAAPLGELRRGPTHRQIGEALAVLDEITVKYLVLLTADGYQTCAPVRAYDWRRVLLRPWVREADLRDMSALG